MAMLQKLAKKPVALWGLAGLLACLAGVAWAYYWRVFYYLDSRVSPAIVTAGCVLVCLAAVAAAGVLHYGLRSFTAKATACIAVCGLLFAFANPPMQTPDESEHFLRTYAISMGRFDFDAERGYPDDVAALYNAFPGAWVNAHTSAGAVEDEKTGETKVYDTAGYALKQYGFHIGEGLYTDMSAIRRDEDTDNIHSIYVDQWDWEKIILKEDRNVEYLKDTVRKVYKALKKTEKYMSIQYDYIEEILPKDIYFITTQELADRYPDKTPKEREDLITKEKGAVFLMEIGDKLLDGKPHDGRAPDYDDWHLNGDIIVWYPVLGHALELSSMGIRVDEDSLARQLKLAGCEERAELPFQKAILEKKLPYTIGGGIGQSRICMFDLRTAQIGEVQVSIWPDEVREEAARRGVNLL